ncbi:unnamed protein product [Periconia digitata]|uniref:Heterokaryon incompatibility domain-containing protein n=1 Tax=Periconia digitata TaxID=1303443 RepID=A0A9W4UA37_9PLEO|nr:unnamed protein product [Periconia digitata]
MNDSIDQFYKDLPISPKSRCIRLLHIHAPDPSKGDDGGPIYSDVTIADLSLNPSFDALSYVWGTSAPVPDVVSCNGIAFHVTSNCYSAMQHLRKMLGSFTIWVDAISLNQKDNLEKAHQIGLMGDIYSGARTTYIWLGKGSASTERAMDLLSKTGFLEFFFENGGDLEQPVRARPRVYASYANQLMARWGLKTSMIPLDTKRKLNTISKRLQAFRENPLCTIEDLEQVFDCMWVKRIWTFQEIVFSANPVVVCGYRRLSWTRLQFSTLFLASIESTNSDYRLHLRRWLNVGYVRTLYHSEVQRDTRYSPPYFQEYWSFCSELTVLSTYLASLRVLVLLLAGYMILAPGLFAVVDTAEMDWMALGFMIIAVLPAMSILLTVASMGVFDIFRGIAPGPDMSRDDLNYPHPPDTKRKIHAQVLEAICTRSATDPRDMSYGIQSILDRPNTNNKTPSVDYTLSKAEVFKQLSIYLLSQQSSIQLLTLAAQRRCEHASSWIPDFSHNLTADCRDVEYPEEWREHDYLYRRPYDVTSHSPHYQRLHPQDDSILIVKGYLFAEVISVAGDGAFALQIASERKTCPGFAHVFTCPGDKLALISGLSFPVLVKVRGENLVEILGIAWVKTKYRRSKRSHSTYYARMSDKEWEAYCGRKRREWIRAHRRPGLSEDDVHIPSRQVYLDDLFIC